MSSEPKVGIRMPMSGDDSLMVEPEDQEYADLLAVQYPWLAGALYGSVVDLHQQGGIEWSVTIDIGKDGEIRSVKAEIVNTKSGGSGETD